MHVSQDAPTPKSNHFCKNKATHKYEQQQWQIDDDQRCFCSCQLFVAGEFTLVLVAVDVAAVHGC